MGYPSHLVGQQPDWLVPQYFLPHLDSLYWLVLLVVAGVAGAVGVVVALVAGMACWAESTGWV